MGEEDGGTSSEGAQLSADRLTSIASGREADTLDLGVGVDYAEDSGVKRCVVSMTLWLARVVTRLSEVASVRRPSVVVSSMGCRETEQDILLYFSGASVRHSSTRGGCADEEGVYGLAERKEGTSAVLPWSYGTAGAKVVEAALSWTVLFEFG